MPYRSQAQRRKFHALLAEGKIAPEVVAEYDRASKGKKLLERVKPKQKKKVKSIQDLRDMANSAED